MQVSCIIPFWNEADRIGTVLSALAEVPIVDEIILVDDGSTDGSIQPTDTRISLYRLEKNQGKSAAMRFGFWKAKGAIILFLDADLKHITSAHIEKLVEPVLRQECAFAIAQREYFSFFDVVGGERVLIKNDWIPFFEKEQFHRNATEIGMNRYILLNNISIKTVKWQKVRQVYKSNKIGFLKGIKKDMSYVVDWMKQMGMLNFSCTYLLFWLLLIYKNSKFTKSGRTLYQVIFKEKFDYLLIQ